MVPCSPSTLAIRNELLRDEITALTEKCEAATKVGTLPRHTWTCTCTRAVRAAARFPRTKSSHHMHLLLRRVCLHALFQAAESAKATSEGAAASIAEAQQRAAAAEAALKALQEEAAAYVATAALRCCVDALGLGSGSYSHVEDAHLQGRCEC